MAASQRRGREQAAPSGGAEHRRACSQDSPQQHRRPRLVTLPLSAQPLSAPPMRGIRSTGLPSRSFNATPRKSGRDMLSNRSKQTASRQVHSSSSRWGGAPVAVSSGASALTDTHARTQPTKRCTPHQHKRHQRHQRHLHAKPGPKKGLQLIKKQVQLITPAPTLVALSALARTTLGSCERRGRSDLCARRLLTWQRRKS